MKETGVVRRIDDLGRIVIPKEIRKSLRIREGDSLEIFVDNNKVYLQKHSHVGEMLEIARHYANAIYNQFKIDVVITDMERVIACNSRLESKFLDKELDEDIVNTIEGKIPKDVNEESILGLYRYNYINPILAYGDLMGSVILSKETPISNDEKKNANIMSMFMSNYIVS